MSIVRFDGIAAERIDLDTETGRMVVRVHVEPPVNVTAENAREIFGAGSVLGEGLAEALSPGGALDFPPPVIVKVTP